MFYKTNVERQSKLKVYFYNPLYYLIQIHIIYNVTIANAQHVRNKIKSKVMLFFFSPKVHSVSQIRYMDGYIIQTKCEQFSEKLYNTI